MEEVCGAPFVLTGDVNVPINNKPKKLTLPTGAVIEKGTLVGRYKGGIGIYITPDVLLKIEYEKLDFSKGMDDVEKVNVTLNLVNW
jgi:hypothetical protein